MRVIANREHLTGVQDLRVVPEPIQPEDPRLAMTEKELQQSVIDLCAVLKYQVYHTLNSKGSAAGFPDLTIVGGRHDRLVFAELKSTKGKVTQSQALWLQELANAGSHVYVWRPYDWITGGIERILRGPRERI